MLGEKLLKTEATSEFPPTIMKPKRTTITLLKKPKQLGEIL